MEKALRATIWAFAAMALFSIAGLTGCGPKDDLKKAHTVVETALNSWKNGEKAQQVAAHGIDIVDDDWKAGHKLIDYTIKSASSQPQQGPRVVVLLNLQRRNGKKLDTEVAYEVIMTDKVKIGRDPFHVP